jgi:hypothetical protein
MADKEWLAQEPVRPRIVQRTQRDSTEPRVNPGAEGGARGLLRLQRSVGNRAFGRVLMLARQGQGLPEVQPEVEQAIQAARGGGQALDHGVRGHMEQAMSADFGGVRIHAGSQADVLNRNLSARAFTTGQDIFFKQGEYSPGSSGGQELLAHELTHVMQQNEGVRRAKAPDEEPEEETGGEVLAKSIRAKPDAVQRGKAPEEEPEEEETGGKVLAKPDTVQRGKAPEEEPEEEKTGGKVLAKSDTVQRRKAPEEEPEEETGGKVLAEPIQAKLTVGAADDQYEQEADRTAGQVMRVLRQGAQRQPERDEERDKLQAKLEASQAERPTTIQLKGEVPVNDDGGLEREADVMETTVLESRPGFKGAPGVPKQPHGEPATTLSAVPGPASISFYRPSPSRVNSLSSVLVPDVRSAASSHPTAPPTSTSARSTVGPPITARSAAAVQRMITRIWVDANGGLQCSDSSERPPTNIGTQGDHSTPFVMLQQEIVNAISSAPLDEAWDNLRATYEVYQELPGFSDSKISVQQGVSQWRGYQYNVNELLQMKGDANALLTAANAMLALRNQIALSAMLGGGGGHGEGSLAGGLHWAEKKARSNNLPSRVTRDGVILNMGMAFDHGRNDRRRDLAPAAWRQHCMTVVSAYPFLSENLKITADILFPMQAQFSELWHKKYGS